MRRRKTERKKQREGKSTRKFVTVASRLCACRRCHFRIFWNHLTHIVTFWPRWHAGQPEFMIVGANRVENHLEKNFRALPLLPGVVLARGGIQFSAASLNRSLMAAPRCARARCAGVNTVGVDWQLHPSEIIEQFPYSLSAGPQKDSRSRRRLPGKGSVPDG